MTTAQQLPHWQDCGAGIYCIDTALQRPGMAACYLLQDQGDLAFIDTGTTHNVPRLMALLAHLGLQAGQVRWVIATHVHLDHAGGLGALLQQLPNATVCVHERGARHLHEPGKLQAGAAAVYGEARYQRLFGDLVPVPAGRLRTIGEGDVIALGKRQLRVLDTAGHARHHVCLLDESSGGLFTGDTGGVCYPQLVGSGGRLVFPPTTPIQFDPEAWRQSLQRLLAVSPTALYLTHYGRHNEPEQLLTQLQTQIEVYAQLARQHSDHDDSATCEADLCATLLAHSQQQLEALGCPLSPAERERLLLDDMQLNAQGLCHWLLKRA